MNEPRRVQLSRKKGAKLPPNTVIVDRRSRWGNPFVVGKDGTLDEVLKKYAEMMLPYSHRGPRNGLDDFFISDAMLRDMESELKGKNLACWCPLGQRCHADLLLAWVNR